MPASHSRTAAKPQHLRPARLHREIVERALVGARGEAQRPDVKIALDAAIEHGRLHHVGAPFPEAWVSPLVPLDDLAGDERVTVEPARQRRNAHAVVDAEL